MLIGSRNHSCTNVSADETVCKGAEASFVARSSARCGVPRTVRCKGSPGASFPQGSRGMFHPRAGTRKASPGWAISAVTAWACSGAVAAASSTAPCLARWRMRRPLIDFRFALTRSPFTSMPISIGLLTKFTWALLRRVTGPTRDLQSYIHDRAACAMSTRG